MQEILSNVDFEVPVGARAVIVGPNGCGKTTLLTTIANRDSVEGLPVQIICYGTSRGCHQEALKQEAPKVSQSRSFN
jgi:ABC-type cobalamin/Fe3+-siderophores transport system ATPase subunit